MGEMTEHIKQQEIKAVLNKYTLKEINNLFNDIDNKIIALMECSSEDFLSLNKRFKEFHTDSKRLDALTQKLFNQIKPDNNKPILESLEKVHEALVNHKVKNGEEYNHLANYLQDLSESLRNLQIPLKNYKQNLSAFNLIEANFSMNNIMENSDHNKAQIQIVHELIKNLKYKHLKLEQGILSLQEKSGKIKLALSTNIDEDQKYTSKSLHKIHNSIVLFKEKHEEVMQYTSEVNATTKHTTESAAHIVTQLQYQDIIKQKIEHISSMHRDLISEVELLDNSKLNGANIHNKVKTFIRIRDVAGLQAAQLLHANSEYQKAIDIISAKFNEFSTHTTAKLNLCQKLTQVSEQENKEDIAKVLGDFLKESKIIIANKIAENESIISMLESLQKDFKAVLRIFEKSVEINNEISKVILTFSKEDTTIDQLIQLESDTKEVLSTIYKTLFCKHEDCNSMHETLITEHDNFIKSMKIKELPIEIENIYNGVIHMSKEMDAASSAITDHGILMNKKIDNALGEIKYYDVFETSISQIINQLSEINFKLRPKDENGERDNSKNLDYLKKRYTMQSEHDIHNHMTGVREEDSVDPEDENVGEVDENDLELF